MPDVKTFIDFIQTCGFVGLLIILAFPTLRAKFGFNGNQVADSDRLAEAMRKAFIEDEHSPILVKGRIERICDDMQKIKENQELMGIDIAIIKRATMKL